MNSKIFNPSSVVLVVITYYSKWYRGKLRSLKHTDKVRGDLAIEFFQEAIKRGYQVVVADGKSSKTFRKTISQMPGLHLIKRRSAKRAVAKRQAILKAAKLPGVKVIIATEPEKISLLTDCLPQLVNPVINGDADIVIPKRENSLFQKTFPKYMYQSETEGNKLYNEILRTHGLLDDREDFDIFFGPRVFANSPKIVRLFTKKFKLKISKKAYLESYFDIDAYSSTLYFPVVIALKKRYKVKSVEVPFSYPKIQKDNEDKGSKEHFAEKRRFQRISILVELLYFMNFIKRN